MEKEFKKILAPHQVEALKQKNWETKAEGFNLILYAEDYSEYGWVEICNVIGCDSSKKEVKILGFGYNQIE
jgi:hypothetical protein